VGRLPVITRGRNGRVAGIITRSDLLAAHERRLDAERRAEPTIRIPRPALWRENEED
jgi:chloride channel protein, CIC family